MNQVAQPNPAQVPTLTEVIELLSPTPVSEGGIQSPARPAPIITRGLPITPIARVDEQGDGLPAWVPMTTLVVPAQEPALGQAVVPLADLPVLDAVVPELVQTNLIPTMTDEVKPVELVVSPPFESVLPEISEAQLAQRVMGDVQRQIDGMLDFRLREAIGPVLARHTEALVKDLREELNRTMRDVVTRSVAQEMAKLRQR